VLSFNLLERADLAREELDELDFEELACPVLAVVVVVVVVVILLLLLFLPLEAQLSPKTLSWCPLPPVDSGRTELDELVCLEFVGTVAPPPCLLPPSLNLLCLRVV